MAFKIKIRSDFPSPLQTRLLRQVCRHRDRHEVYVSHFNRFGLSGARLLLIYFSDEPDSLPFLLKISRFEKAESEYNSTKVLESYVQDAGFAARRKTCILYIGFQHFCRVVLALCLLKS